MNVLRHTLRLVGAILLVMIAQPANVAARGGVDVPGLTPMQPAPTVVEPLWQEARRLFDSFQYEASIAALDRLITTLTAPGAQEQPGLLVQVYELRARARFALGDIQNTEADFVRVLELRPNFTPSSGISPRVIALFDGVKKRTVGQVLLSVAPQGEVAIESSSYTVGEQPQAINLLPGSHTLIVRRRGYRDVTQQFSVIAGEVVSLALKLERTVATLGISTVPDGAEVSVDGVPRGTTGAGEPGAKASAPLVVDVPLGAHRLQLRRPCHAMVEREVKVDRLDDFLVGPIELPPAVATASVLAEAVDATVLLDGTARGPAPAELTGVCEGEHVVEVRSSRGRFIDRQMWRAGERKAIKAVLLPSFAIIGLPESGADAPLTPLAAAVERALRDLRGVLFQGLADAELTAALAAESLGRDRLVTLLTEAAAGDRRNEQLRDVGRRLAARLGAQGVAWVVPSKRSGEAILSILASGSGRPDVLSFEPSDARSREPVRGVLERSAPPLVRRTLELSLIDVADVPGAVVARLPASGPATQPGLEVGDVVVGIGDRPVASVADVLGLLGDAPSSTPVALQVRGRDGRARTVNLAVVDSPNPIPLRDRSLAYNKLLLEMRDAVAAPGSALSQAVARLNLAIAHVNLANWDEALRELQQVGLSGGPGVSSATVDYVAGLCHEALGRVDEARAAFTRAAASDRGTLWFDGPLVRLLAQQELGAPP